MVTVTMQVSGEPAAASLAVNHVQRSVKPKWSCSQEVGQAVSL